MRIPRDGTGRASRLGAPILLLASILACADQRLILVDKILEDRASHLDPEVRREVAEALVRAESSRGGVDAILLIAVIEQESRFRAKVVSPKNAFGLMQLRPATAADVASRHGMPFEDEKDLQDPAKNVSIGSTYLAELKEEFETWELALAAYLNGPTKVRAALEQGREVRSRYATRVLRRMKMIEELYVTDGGSS